MPQLLDALVITLGLLLGADCRYGMGMDVVTMKSVFWSAFRIVLGVYGGLCVVLYLRQSKMVYYPLPALEVTPKEAGLAYEEVSFVALDGIRLTGWFVPAKAPRGTILLFHGNGGNISHRLSILELFHELNLDVLIVDYRGYGLSEGKPDEEGTYRDAQAAWDYLVRTRGVAPEKILIHGRSLGGGVASWLAIRVPSAGLILESTFTSVPDLGQKLYPYLPVRWLCKYSYDTLSRMGALRCPVLIAHSREDEMIPFQHGKTLYEAAHEPKTFVELRGGHNDGEDLFEPHYREALDRFIGSCLNAPPSPRPD